MHSSCTSRCYRCVRDNPSQVKDIIKYCRKHMNILSLCNKMEKCLVLLGRLCFDRDIIVRSMGNDNQLCGNLMPVGKRYYIVIRDIIIFLTPYFKLSNIRHHLFFLRLLCSYLGPS